MYQNFGVNENHGDSTSNFHGDSPEKDYRFLDRYLQEHGKIRSGKIAEVFMGGYVAHVVAGSSSYYAIWLTKLLGGAAGGGEFSIPSAGSTVLVFMPHHGPYCILGCIPTKESDDGIQLYEAESTEENYYTQEQYNYLSNQDGTKQLMEFFNDTRPMDVFPGEFGYVNELGSILGLLKGILLLKATDLAQIQLHFIDDLVRVVSKSYEHFSSIGEDIIYDDHGKVSREIRISTTRDEASGNKEPTEILKLNEGIEDKLYEKKEYKELIDRLRLHIGFIGDLVHLYSLNVNGNGLFDMHLRKDGSLSVESTKSIEFKKVLKVKIPNRKKRYQETEEQIIEDIKPFVHIPGSKEVQDVDRLQWEYKGFDHRKYGDETWDLKSEAPINEEIPTETVIGSSQVTQREDGSIILKDVAGSFIELDGKGNINISCSGQLNLRTGGDTVSLSGGSTTLRSKENLDICCTEGDIRAKAENAFQIYSKDKGILIETDSSATPDTAQNENHVYGGIKIKTNEEAPITLDSGQNVNVWSQKNNIIHATEENRIESGQKLNMGSLEVNLIGVTGTGNDIELNGGTPINALNIKATEFAAEMMNCKMNAQMMFQLSSLTINITGTALCTIFGGGGIGTIVNHTHSQVTGDIMQYVYDGGTDNGAPDPGEKIQIIEKISIPVPVINTPPVIMPKTDLMTPFDKAIIDLTEFSFRSEVYHQKMYEHFWQSQSGTDWDFEGSDTFQNASPFPGKGFAKYNKYNFTNGESNEAGSFSEGGISGYVI